MSDSEFESGFLERLMEIHGVRTDAELARRLGKSPSSVHNWRKRGNIPIDECIRVAKSTGASLDWLILGIGDGPGTKVTEGLHPYLALPSEEGYAEIPLYDIEAAAGDGCLFDEEHVIGTIPYRREQLIHEGLAEAKLVALKVRGDSMMPTLDDGDTVIVNLAHRQPDGVFLVRVGDALRIKRVQRMMAGCLRLSSDNDHYAPEVISPDQVDGFEILGSVYSRTGRVF